MPDMPQHSDENADFLSSLSGHLELLYPEHSVDSLIADVNRVFGNFSSVSTNGVSDRWSARDCILITYGDSLREPGLAPLESLNRFLDESLPGIFSTIHVLPFSPFSSDDGFAVVDYREVNPTLGDWSHINSLTSKHKVMADLVINHVSSESEWFSNYVKGRNPGKDYFIEISDADDISQVIRPRISPLRRPTNTPDGIKHLWCTFSHDQIDLNFGNPEVMLEFLKIIRLYLEQGIRIFRLDAVGFLWKESGTTCIHLPKTHEVVRLLRTVVDHYVPNTVLITETNVPNHENLSYFGNRNEAHIVYNFSLAPLLVHALLTAETHYLKRWLMSMPPAPAGCTYLNFVASHDGIGMRPAEGLLSEQEQAQMVETIVRFGGRVSTRRSEDGGERVYELNISLFDAMKGTVDGEDEWQLERFLCSQTVMMAVEGIPAVYIHSLLATPNDENAVQATGHNRSINRPQLDVPMLKRALADEETSQSQAFRELTRRLQIRCCQAAFHPNATQFTLQSGDAFFAFWRQSRDREQSIFAVNNLSAKHQQLRLTDLNLISLDVWYDLISGDCFTDLNATVEVRPYQCLWITNAAPNK